MKNSRDLIIGKVVYISIIFQQSFDQNKNRNHLMKKAIGI